MTSNIFPIPFTGSLGVNGFGRIGKAIVRQAIMRERVARVKNPSKVEVGEGSENDEFDSQHFLRVAAINDPFVTTAQIADALKYDTTFGEFDGTVSLLKDVNGLSDRIHVTTRDKVVDIAIGIYHFKSTQQIPWQEANVAIVVDCSGKTKCRAAAELHGANKVILSCPTDDTSIPTIVPGVNQDAYVAHTSVLSMASCTTNCLAPIALVLDEAFGIEQGIFSTIHAVTASQPCVDAHGSRSCMDNIIPSTTGAEKALSLVLPGLRGKLSGNAVRVPVTDVSLLELTVVLKRPCSPDSLTAAVNDAAGSTMDGIISLSCDDRVSSDFKCCTTSCVVLQKESVFLNEHFIKVSCFYDNEFAYAAKLLDLGLYVIEEDYLRPKQTHGGGLIC